MEELKPSFIIYTALLPATPTERLAAIATAAAGTPTNKPLNRWIYIHEDNNVYSAELGCQIPIHLPRVWVELSDRGNGPELCMEFYNCDPPEGILYYPERPPQTDHGDGHGDEAW